MLLRVCVAIALAALAGCGSPETQRPDIVVIYTDDQSVNSLPNMPKLKEIMADKGVTFANSFVDFSLCCPSRASLLTGQAAHNTGIVGIKPSEFGGYELFKPLAKRALPVSLQEAGYETALFGKFLNGYGASSRVDYDLNIDGALVDLGKPKRGGVPPGWNRWVAYVGTAGPEDDDLIADYAAEWIAEADRSTPLFVMVATKSPHLPHVPPKRHDGAFADLPLPMPPSFNEADISDKPAFNQPPLLTAEEIAEVAVIFRKRQEQLKGVEDVVAKVVDALSDAGRLDDAIIVFTSDNGYSTGEHRRKEGKLLHYEEIIRVPLIVRGPGIPEGETRSQLVNNLDLAATILDWAGATPKLPLDGRSLAPVIADMEAPWRTHLLVQGRSADQLSQSISPTANRFKAVRSDHWMFVRHNLADGTTVEELYDLAADPWQLSNLSADPVHDGVGEQLRQVLAGLAECAGESCWVTTPEPAAPPAATALSTGG